MQLQEDPTHDLEEVSQALRQAIELDKDSPTAAIELGHFLDNVEDDPQAAVESYAEGITAARKLLIEGLIGQAKALLQLEKWEGFHRCVMEVLHLARFEAGSKRHKTEEAEKDVVFESPTGHLYAIQLKGPYAEQIQELLCDVVARHSAKPKSKGASVKTG